MSFDKENVFGKGNPNDAYAAYFDGKSFLNVLTGSDSPIFMANVTFEPGCRNHWHIHHAEQGGGQMLLCVAGRGYYQEWGCPARELHPGDVVVIKPGVKHWHGAAKDSWFSHVSVEVPAVNGRNEWLEAVDEAEYAKLK